MLVSIALLHIINDNGKHSPNWQNYFPTLHELKRGANKISLWDSPLNWMVADSQIIASKMLQEQMQRKERGYFSHTREGTQVQKLQIHHQWAQLLILKKLKKMENVKNQ